MNKWKVTFWITLLAIFALGATQFQKVILVPTGNCVFGNVSASTTTATAINAVRGGRSYFNVENDSTTLVCVSTSAITQGGISAAKQWTLGQNERLPAEMESYTGILYAISSGTTGNPVTLQTIELYR